MYQRLFSARVLPITWQVFVLPGGKCPVELYWDDLERSLKIKLIAKMEAFAEAGWAAHASSMKQLHTSSPRTVYEIKSHQQRIAFIRCNDDAVAIFGFTKKTDWSKKEKSTLKAMEPLIEAAASECGGRQ